MKKRIFLIITILTIILLTVLLFMTFRDTDKIILKNDEFIFELGDNISSDVSFYLKNADSVKNIKDFKLSSNDLKIVDNKLVINKDNVVGVGNYLINISYKKNSKEIVIKIIDTISPKFTKMKEKIEVEQTSDDINLMSYFETDDLSEVNLSIEGDYNLNEIGDYNLNIIATDSSNNTTKKEFLLKVLKKEIPKEEDKKNTHNDTTSSTNNSSMYNKPTTPSSSTSNTLSPRYRKDISDSYVSTVNAYRKANGLSELPVTSEAQTEADRRAKELCIYYSHDGAGYGFGEIIGNGTIGGDFITAWKNSPPHNATMLREQAVAMAASVYECNNKWYAIISFRMNY